MPHKRGRVWRAITELPGIQISIYFIAFALLIGLYTYIFHLVLPVSRRQAAILDRSALLFVVAVHDNGREYGISAVSLTLHHASLYPDHPLRGHHDLHRRPAAPCSVPDNASCPYTAEKTPHVFSGHTVVFGYDELTRSVVDSLTISDHDIVIIEQDKAAALEIATLYRRRAYVIWGDYTDPATWAAAHIANAHFVDHLQG